MQRPLRTRTASRTDRPEGLVATRVMWVVQAAIRVETAVICHPIVFALALRHKEAVRNQLATSGRHSRPPLPACARGPWARGRAIFAIGENACQTKSKPATAIRSPRVSLSGRGGTGIRSKGLYLPGLRTGTETTRSQTTHTRVSRVGHQRANLAAVHRDHILIHRHTASLILPQSGPGGARHEYGK